MIHFFSFFHGQEQLFFRNTNLFCLTYYLSKNPMGWFLSKKSHHLNKKCNQQYLKFNHNKLKVKKGENCWDTWYQMQIGFNCVDVESWQV